MKRLVSYEQFLDSLSTALFFYEHQYDVKPDLIIGVGRGGLIPATYISYELDVPMTCMIVKSYDKHKQTYNCEVFQHPRVPREAKNVLVVDDINDTGCTFSFIKNYFDQTAGFDDAAKPNLQFLSIFGKPHTTFESIVGEWVSNDEWVIFPWDKYECE
ncbi:MAG: hypothetical protein EBU90_20000 [Proteobacteria bacterium]|nr:hypothetical protein [Pseudomonadota bacterium]